MNHVQQIAPLALTAALFTFAGCSGSRVPGQADIQATIEASVRATSAAQQAAAPTNSAPAPVATVPAEPAPTSAPFAPATAEATTTVATAAPVPQSAPPAATTAAFAPGQGQNAQTVNIELIFDASGSMAESIGGETKIQAARRAMEQVIAQLPDNAPNFNVGFRVYGNKGDNSEAQKALSCSSTELLVPLNGIDKALLSQQTNAFQPTGWTPISLALQKAGEDLKPGENTKNVIIMVTDGEETCQGNPCAVAKALNESGAEVRIDVVGFGTTPQQDTSLRCVADNSGGTYSNAPNGQTLTQALQDLITATVKRSYLRVTAVGPDGQPLVKDSPWENVVGLVSLTDGQGQRAPVPEGELAGEGQFTTLETKGEQRYELPPGTYTFVVQQQIGYNKLRGDLPQSNAAITYTAQIAEGQETQALVGVGALLMTAQGGELEYACDLQLDVALNGRWQPVYPAVKGFCNRQNDVVQGAGLAFDREYALLPGRYRLVDMPRGQVLSDQIVIEPGKTVRITLQGLARTKQ